MYARPPSGVMATPLIPGMLMLVTPDVLRLMRLAEPVPVFVNESFENAKKVFPARISQIHADRPEIIPYVDVRRWILAFPVSDAAHAA